MTESLVITLRDDLGERLVGFYTPTDGDILLDPPVLLLPADLEPGRSWQGEGQLGGVGYRWSAEVDQAGPFEARSTRFDDCLHVQTRFTLVRGQQTVRETLGSDWYCAEVGLVESEELDVGSGTATRSVLVGQEGGAERVGAAADGDAACPRRTAGRRQRPRLTTWAILPPGC